MFKAEVDISSYLGNYVFMEHEITTRRQRSNVTRLTFKNIPLNIPDKNGGMMGARDGRSIEM